MAEIELEAFWTLETLGCLDYEEYYLPGKAEQGYYTQKLKHARQLLKQGNQKRIQPTPDP